jgi:hypothetical protein
MGTARQAGPPRKVKPRPTYDQDYGMERRLLRSSEVVAAGGQVNGLR